MNEPHNIFDDIKALFHDGEGTVSIMECDNGWLCYQAENQVCSTCSRMIVGIWRYFKPFDAEFPPNADLDELVFGATTRGQLLYTIMKRFYDRKLVDVFEVFKDTSDIYTTLIDKKYS